MEMEAHHEIKEHDSFGKFIGVQTAILAVLLSVFTIFSHREHTNTLLYSNEASDSWAHYQAKRIRSYQLDMNSDLIKLLAPASTEAVKTLSAYAKQTVKYDKELEEIKAEAQTTAKAEGVAHHKAGYFDLAEALFEIAVILSSLYFISRKKLFPSIGIVFAGIGLLVGVCGLLIH